MIKVTTIQKKSIVETETYERTINGQTYYATLENTWRWGYAIIDAKPEEIDLDGDITITDYEIEDQSFDDGVASFWIFNDDVPEPIRQELEAAWEESWYDGVEQLGWYNCDTETTFIGPLEIEVLEETPKAETIADPNARKWPF